MLQKESNIQKVIILKNGGGGGGGVSGERERERERVADSCFYCLTDQGLLTLAEKKLDHCICNIFPRQFTA